MKPEWGLRPSTRSSSWQFGTWDIEARDWWDLIIIGMWDGREYRAFRSVGEFLQEICRPKYHGWKFFAHYGGRYDINFVFDWLMSADRGIRWSFVCSGSSVVRMRLSWGRRYHVDLCDSYRLLPSSLRSLTDTFQTEVRKWDRPDWESVEYNRDDCIALHQVLERWFSLVGEHAETLASTAMRVFRRRHLRDVLYPAPAEAEDAVREAYVGGRVEVIRRKPDRPARMYDVNSMYPWAMTHPLPVRYAGRVRRRNPARWGVYRVRVGVPDMEIPPLPCRSRKLIFPVGVWDGILTGTELDLAEELGAVIRVDEGWEWETEPVLQSYVEDLYDRRVRAEDPAEKLVWKLLLNSLYGKFGQSREAKVYLADDGSEGIWPIYRPDGTPSGAAYRLEVSRASHLLPHIACAVTALGRVRLWRLLSGSDPLYCDTDSVVTESDLPTGPGLGELKLEGTADPDSAEFWAPKLYRFGEKWRAKGLPDEDPETVRRYAGFGTVEWERSATLVESIRCRHSCRRIRVVARRNMMDLPKRCWIDGIRTRPWVVRDGELY